MQLFVGVTRAVYDRRVMTATRILFFLLTAFVSRPQTPESAVSLADTQQRTLRSAKIGQRYELLASLPAGYAKSGESYPVMYVLDGWHFPLMAFIQENDVYSKRMRPVTIVDVSHGATDYMALRARDFTPTRTPQEANSGSAAAFLDFLEHELIPFVDRTWRTIPTDRGLLGHSYGGLFVNLRAGAAACTVPADCRGEPIVGVGWPTAFDRCA
jgi:enterochelin esterase-like enzyme